MGGATDETRVGGRPWVGLQVRPRGRQAMGGAAGEAQREAGLRRAAGEAWGGGGSEVCEGPRTNKMGTLSLKQHD